MSSREYQKKYWETYGVRNRDKIVEYARRYRMDHPDRCRAAFAKMREKHPERVMFNAAKARAKSRSVTFSISVSDISIPARCPALGIPLRRAKGVRNDNSPTLDRIDPRRGYVPGNVCVISYRANRIKNDATREELVSIAKYLSRYARRAQTIPS